MEVNGDVRVDVDQAAWGPAHLSGLSLDQLDEEMRLAQTAPMSVLLNGLWLIWAAAEMN